MKSKETPTNKFVDSSREEEQNNCYEYDDIHETFRKYEEEKNEMDRLINVNREYRSNVLKLNLQCQMFKERNLYL
jgi:hypothetical protein